MTTEKKTEAAEAEETASGVSAEAMEIARQDQQWRNEHPNEVRSRDANPAVGGESFAYLSPDKG